jgi:hypothetical protein
LEYRKRLGENITPESPLIREIFGPDNPFTIGRPKRCSYQTIMFALEKALQKAGVNQRAPTLGKGKRRDTLLSHGYRKHVITTMVNAGVKDEARRYLTGHAQLGQDASYVLLKEEELLAEYVKAIPFLSIDLTQRLKQENHDLKTVQAKEIERLEAQLKTKEEKDLERSAEWEALKREMSELKTLVYPLHPGIPRDKQRRAVWWKLTKAQYKEKGENVSDWPDEIDCPTRYRE